MKILSHGFRPASGRWLDILTVELLILSLLVSLVSISLEQALFFLAVAAWAVRMIKAKESLAFPRFFLPLIVYAGFSLVASALSVNRGDSFRDSRELILLIMVPLAYTAFRAVRDIGRANVAILVSAGVSLLYSAWYVLFKAGPGERVKGFMGHYMTQAGLLVLFAALALSMAAFSHGRRRFVWAAAFLLTCPALMLTLTRSAWIGLVVVVCVVLLSWRPKLVILVPVVAAAAYFASPATVKERARSIFSSQAYSNRVRLEYARAGFKIIRNFPLHGTGPDTVELEYQNPKYGLSDEARRLGTHLHNDYLQIAAERGIPTVLAWLAFVVWAAVDLVRLLRKPRDATVQPLAVAGLAALLAFLVAGVFEYNWGDSEITFLLLYLITIPFAAFRLASSRD
ncbi:MAG: O-antigen ligase family protein [Candidatus Aminicenantes bacterium]|nr:O-antigen ligase family protein [Candidatus Aminicenantes bacterium]